MMNELRPNELDARRRDEEATSDETLADVEETEELSDEDDGEDATVPSPDGAFDEDEPNSFGE